jgi:ornithine decarboxylase
MKSLSVSQLPNEWADEMMPTLAREVFYPKHQDPTLHLSTSKIDRNFYSLIGRLNPDYVYYAVKSNDNVNILKELDIAGSNFDVCSPQELTLVLNNTKAKPDDILYSHPIKSLGDFDYAVSAGVKTFVVDNPSEVMKLQRYHREKLKVLIRFRITPLHQAHVNLQYKFGCDINEVMPLAYLIRSSGHEVAGLCFHVGSQCIYKENYVDAINHAAVLLSVMKDQGFKPSILDIGGGFPVRYMDPLPDMDDFFATIKESLRKVPKEVMKICEPGRYISAGAVTLSCSISGKAFRDGKIWYYLNDGMYSTFSGRLYDHCTYPIITNNAGELKESVLAGPTCDSIDVIYDDILMPEHEIGDILLAPMVGAYCSVSASNFNWLNKTTYKIVR